MWAAQPVSSDWTTAANWTPQSVPNAVMDTATFGPSSFTDVELSANIDLGLLSFSRGASAFTITAEPATVLFFNGAGIENASGILQNFVCVRDGGFGGGFYFLGDAAAGKETSFTVAGNLISFQDSSNADHATFMVTPDPGVSEGDILFFDSSSASDATFMVPSGGVVNFDYRSTAANAVFTITGGIYGPGSVGFGTDSTAANAVVTCSSGGAAGFSQSATADHARFTLAGAASVTESACSMIFGDSSTGASARFVINGGSAPGASGALLQFFESATAGAAKLAANGGTAGGLGGAIQFYAQSDGGTATFIVSGNGTLDISKHGTSVTTCGAVQGNGLVILGSRALAVGSNNRDAAFAGTIQDTGGVGHGTGGALTKLGSGDWTLSGASTYIGGTTVSSGVLTVANVTGSATGTGSVNVNGGSLGGKGMISGPVTIGTGSGSGAILAPSVGSKQPLTLSLTSLLTLQGDSTYTCQLSTQKAKADEVIAQRRDHRNRRAV